MYVIYLRKEMLSALKFQNKARLFIIWLYKVILVQQDSYMLESVVY